jgi:5,5'-dehydrodivanillate O-demethylase
MLSAEQNRQLTEVGSGTPMGKLLRCYWHPIAGESEFNDRAIKPVRILGEDMVLYKDLSGNFGLVERQCPHRRADLSYGIIEENGIRCNYHGWCFDQTGACIEQPFEDTVRQGRGGRGNVRATAYPVRVLAGMIWAYMGADPVPELPDWEPFSWPNGFSQVVVSAIPCNWLQCQENSIDPVHFEWMHENWGQRLRGEDGAYGPTHLKLEFDEFDYGFVYRRIKEDTDESHENWTIGRVCLWPNGFFLGEHFEWRVPIDDVNTLSVTWKFTRVPAEETPYVQAQIPTWEGPIYDEKGQWITSHVMNQDFLAWVGQGRIADRSRENLGLSDKGIVMIRRRFFDEMKRIEAGEEAKGVIRDPARNHAVQLPMMARADVIDGFTKAEIMADPRKRMMFTSFVFQAGQPGSVQQAFSEAMGLDATEFTGLARANDAAEAGHG